MSEIEGRITERIAELRKTIKALEAVDAGTNEPVIAKLKAQMAELVGLLRPASWRAGVVERGI